MTPSIGPVTLSGPAWAASAHCAQLSISEAVSSPFLYELEVISEAVTLPARDTLGHELSIGLEVGGDTRYCKRPSATTCPLAELTLLREVEPGV